MVLSLRSLRWYHFFFLTDSWRLHGEAGKVRQREKAGGVEATSTEGLGGARDNKKGRSREKVG